MGLDKVQPKQELRHSGADRFREFVEFAPDAIVGVGKDGVIAIVNAQAEALFGYSRRELVGQSVETLVPGRFHRVHPQHRAGYFRDPRTRPMGADLQLAGRRRDGSEFPAEISLSSIETDDGPLAMAAVRDVSEREQARRQFEQLLEFAPDAIVGVDHDGLIVLVNAQTESLFGYSRAELIGRTVETLVPDRFHAAHPGHRRRYFQDARTRPMGAELQLFGRRKDGSEFPAEISLSSIETPDGAIATAAVRDISERVDAERRREQLERELAQARRLDAERERQSLEAQLNQLGRLDSVGQLAGGIAHDFNNILGVILNYAHFAADEIGASSPAYEDVQEISRAAQRAADLTRQLLIFSRREPVHPQVLDLNQVVGNLDRLLRRTLGEHIELDTRFAADLSPIEADPGQIEQVLVNLAVNARDAMPAGGRLTIETAEVEVDEEYAGMNPDAPPGRYVRLVVSDTGTGMTPDVRAHAYEPFFTTKPAGRGTGLGLATVYGIVVEAGGNIALYSEPGMGTTVRVLLPATESPLTPAERPAPEVARSHGESILVVEDEAAVRRIAERILDGAGYRVLTASGGFEALAIASAAETSIDLLLSDVIMPNMLGPDLAKQIQARRPDMRVLFMSGYFHQVVADLEKSDEPFEFIEKPFTADVLLRGVRTTLDKPLAEAAAGRG